MKYLRDQNKIIICFTKTKIHYKVNKIIIYKQKG